MIDIEIKKLFPSAKIPERQHYGDAGYDLFALEDVIVPPFERRLVRTGISIAIPLGYYGRIAPRSGLAWKHGIDILAGVIDSTYRGDIQVVMINLAMINALISYVNGIDAFQRIFGFQDALKIKAGDRIAQLIIEKSHEINWIETDILPESSRNENGFGSTNR